MAGKQLFEPCAVCGKPAAPELGLPCHHDPVEWAHTNVRKAIIAGLHRWLEWDFPTAQKEYSDGAAHILNALQHQGGGRG